MYLYIKNGKRCLVEFLIFHALKELGECDVKSNIVDRENIHL